MGGRGFSTIKRAAYFPGGGIRLHTVAGRTQTGVKIWLYLLKDAIVLQFKVLPHPVHSDVVISHDYFATLLHFADDIDVTFDRVVVLPDFG